MQVVSHINLDACAVYVECTLAQIPDLLSPVITFFCLFSFPNSASEKKCPDYWM